MSDKPTINIDIEAYHSLEPEDVFPDGVPESYTAEDIMKMLTERYGLLHNLRDWELLRDMTVRIHVVGSPSAEAQT